MESVRDKEDTQREQNYNKGEEKKKEGGGKNIRENVS